MFLGKDILHTKIYIKKSALIFSTGSWCQIMVYSNCPVVVTGWTEQRQVCSVSNCHFGRCNYCCQQTHLWAGKSLNCWSAAERRGKCYLQRPSNKKKCFCGKYLKHWISSRHLDSKWGFLLPLSAQVLLLRLFSLPRIGNVYPIIVKRLLVHQLPWQQIVCERTSGSLTP